MCATTHLLQLVVDSDLNPLFISQVFNLQLSSVAIEKRQCDHLRVDLHTHHMITSHQMTALVRTVNFST